MNENGTKSLQRESIEIKQLYEWDFIQHDKLFVSLCSTSTYSCHIYAKLNLWNGDLWWTLYQGNVVKRSFNLCSAFYILAYSMAIE